MERLEFAQMILQLDPILDKILYNMRRQGKDLLEVEKAKKANEKASNAGGVGGALGGLLGSSKPAATAAVVPLKQTQESINTSPQKKTMNNLSIN